jgi:hypothetical protein
MKRKYISSRRNEIVLINIKRLFYVGKKKIQRQMEDLLGRSGWNFVGAVDNISLKKF